MATLPYSKAVPVAPYSHRPPSPPYIHVPSSLSSGGGRPTISFESSHAFDDVDTTGLTPADLALITRTQDFIANVDRPVNWVYESRREAQEIIDFMWLGPAAVVRDHSFLRKAMITMILVVRDSRHAQRRLLSVDKAAQELQLEAEYVDVQGTMGLIAAFPDTVRRVNRHLVDVYRAQPYRADTMPRHGDGETDGDTPIRLGRVLVVCETGNDRSAAIVAAYLMAMSGTDMFTAVQFVGVQRFCANFDEETKRLLQSWGDIVKARREVADQRRRIAAAMPTTEPTAAPVNGLTANRGAKRGIDDSYAMEDDDGVLYLEDADRDRFVDRNAFVPFVDVPVKEDTAMAD